MEEIYRSQFRLPYTLYEQLKGAADKNRRAVNAELVARLEYTMLLDSEMAARTGGDFDYSDTLSWLAGSESEAEEFLKERNELEQNPAVLDATDIANQVERRLHGSDLEKLSVITALLLAFPDAVTDAHRKSLLEISAKIVGCAGDRPAPLAALSVALAKLKADVNYRSEAPPLQSE